MKNKKRKVLCSLLAITVLLSLTGCFNDDVKGVWYSDDEGGSDIIIFKKDNFYTSLGNGVYETDKEHIALIGKSPGFGVKEMELKEKDGETVLTYTSGSAVSIYYSDKDLAKKEIDKKIKKTEKENRAKLKEIKSTVNAELSGSWQVASKNKKGQIISSIDLNFDGDKKLAKTVNTGGNITSVETTYEISSETELKILENAEPVSYPYQLIRDANGNVISLKLGNSTYGRI